MEEGQTDQIITSVVMTGQYDARQLSIQPTTQEGNLLPDLGDIFWTPENEQFIKTLWTEVSIEMNRRFGTTISEFNKNQIYMTIIPPSQNASAYHETLNGRIIIDINSFENNYELAHILAHEMGHYYAARKILHIQSGEQQSYPLRAGISAAKIETPSAFYLRESPVTFGGNFTKKELSSKLKYFQNASGTLSVFDEALVELTMTDVLRTVSQNIKELQNSIDSTESYSEPIKLFKNLMYAISDAVQISETGSDAPRRDYQRTRVNRILEKRKLTTLYYHSVVQIFQEAAWGSKNENPSFNEIASLINFTLGPDSFKHIVELTSHIDPCNPKDSKEWHLLQQLISDFYFKQ